MPKKIQRLMAHMDIAISNMLRCEAWGTGNKEGDNKWTYFVGLGHKIGIVGVDGNVHTVMSYWSVNHYYQGRLLLRRIPVRKDLKPGERRATRQEIRQWRLG